MFMSQVILESNNLLDMQLLLSLAERLNIKVVSVSDTFSNEENKLDLIREAANDPLFLEDMDSIMDDFKHVDSENI